MLSIVFLRSKYMYNDLSEYIHHFAVSTNNNSGDIMTLYWQMVPADQQTVPYLYRGNLILNRKTNNEHLLRHASLRRREIRLIFKQSSYKCNAVFPFYLKLIFWWKCIRSILMQPNIGLFVLFGQLLPVLHLRWTTNVNFQFHTVLLIPCHSHSVPHTG